MAETTLSERRNKTRLNFYERHWAGFQLIGPDKNNQNLLSDIPILLKIDVLCYWLRHTFYDWLKWSSYSYANLKYDVFWINKSYDKVVRLNARIEPICVAQYKPAFRLFKENSECLIEQ